MSRETVSYLCVDDKPDEVSLALKRLSASGKNLRIKCEPPKDFKAEIKRIAKLRSDGNLDGIIIDLRLDESGQQGQVPVDYRAQQLASELRSRMATRSLPDFPIILWSINQKLARFFCKDVLNHDLFDYVLHKESLHQSEPETAQQLVSLARGYARIANEKRGAGFWNDVLLPPNGVSLDLRIGESFATSLKTVPVHVIAGYIFRKLVGAPGPLVNEDLLRARLGITEQSFQLPALKRAIDKVGRYSGPFSEGWKRWWWPSIEDWWNSKTEGRSPILSLTSEERGKVLNRIFKVKKLQPSPPLAPGYSSRFTTVCQQTGKPLDPVDGFMLTSAGLESWQDRLYVSGVVALKPSQYGFDSNSLAPTELNRAVALRKQK